MNAPKQHSIDHEDKLLFSLGNTFKPDEEEFEKKIIARLAHERVHPLIETRTSNIKRKSVSVYRLAYVSIFLFLPLMLYLNFGNPFVASPTAQVVAAVGEFSFSNDPTGNKIFSGEIIQTGKDNQISFLMEDRSFVRMDVESKVQTVKPRYIHFLQGRMHAQVAQTSDREQFQIKTSQVEITVLGTEFEVTSSKNSTTVTVIEGKVQVKAQGRTEILEANETLTLSVQDRNAKKQIVNAVQPLWLNRLIEAESKSPVMNVMGKHFPSRSLNALN